MYACHNAYCGLPFLNKNRKDKKKGSYGRFDFDLDIQLLTVLSFSGLTIYAKA